MSSYTFVHVQKHDQCHNMQLTDVIRYIFPICKGSFTPFDGKQQNKNNCNLCILIYWLMFIREQAYWSITNASHNSTE